MASDVTDPAAVAANHPLNGVQVADERWRHRARCRGLATVLFFPVDEDGPEAETAKAVCAECAVTKECLDAALKGKEDYGVWGGTTPRERRRRRRRDRRTA